MVRSGDEAEWGTLELDDDVTNTSPFQFASDDVTAVRGEAGRAEVVLDLWRRWKSGGATLVWAGEKVWGRGVGNRGEME